MQRIVGAMRNENVGDVQVGSQLAVFRMKNSTGWPLEADGIDCPDRPDHAGSGNVGLWVSIQPVVATHSANFSAGE